MFKKIRKLLKDKKMKVETYLINIAFQLIAVGGITFSCGKRIFDISDM